MVGSTLIEDGAITTDKILAGAITSDSGVIGNSKSSENLVRHRIWPFPHRGEHHHCRQLLIGDLTELALLPAGSGFQCLQWRVFRFRVE